jgi:LmbE family N-acetylglucosaminyl deacetylase
MPVRSFTVLVACVLLSWAALFAQSSLEQHQAFLDLHNETVLMDLSAHPDDEDGATLAYYRMKYGVKTYSVLFTRGEGGQNEKGPELYEELGVLRSAETRAAGLILGAEVHFLNFLDFGYSKTATETFRIWGGQMEVLRRLVFVIRKYKPDVLFTNHTTIDGHGNHQAVAITAIAAFDAAADTTIFPEQLKLPGITPWQPKKLFFRVWGRADIVPDVVHHVDERDTLRHQSYAEIAVEALRQHKTQGMDRFDFRGFMRGRTSYRLMRANSIYEPDSTSFFAGIRLDDDPSAMSFRQLRDVLSQIHDGMPTDSLVSGASVAQQLIASLGAQATLSPLGLRLLHNRADVLQTLLILGGNVNASLRLDDSIVVPRQRVDCELHVSSASCSVSDVRWHASVPSGWVLQERQEAAPSLGQRSYERPLTLTVGDTPVYTLPRAEAQYGALEREQSASARVDLLLDGHPVSLNVPARFEVAPFQTLVVSPSPAGMTSAQRKGGALFSYEITNHLPQKTAGRLTVVCPPGWSADEIPFAINAAESTAKGTLRVVAPTSAREGEYRLAFRTGVAQRDVSVNLFDVKVAPGLLVGVIRSYDTTLEEALDDLGVRHVLLSPDDLASGDLRRFTTIIVDIRAYLVREDLRNANARLLSYASEGGNLVVMYQRDQEWKPEYAPFPFTITRKRVADEEAPISTLQPSHPLLSEPNRISSVDWSGWKQERAVYFPGDVATPYVQLLSSHDPDEPALTTGYLVAAVGKGSYLYTSYVWYRQLKEHNPGAFRCFANMLSYPEYRK